MGNSWFQVSHQTEATRLENHLNCLYKDRSKPADRVAALKPFWRAAFKIKHTCTVKKKHQYDKKGKNNCVVVGKTNPARTSWRKPAVLCKEEQVKRNRPTGLFWKSISAPFVCLHYRVDTQTWFGQIFWNYVRLRIRFIQIQVKTWSVNK